MEKFIYVFDTSTKDVLLSMQYVLLKTDIKNNVYIFENKQDCCLNFENSKYVLSNTLTF